MNQVLGYIAISLVAVVFISTVVIDANQNSIICVCHIISVCYFSSDQFNPLLCYFLIVINFDKIELALSIYFGDASYDYVDINYDMQCCT